MATKKMPASQASGQKQRRVKLTLSMTERDRHLLEAMANDEGVTMAGLVHKWIQEHAEQER